VFIDINLDVDWIHRSDPPSGAMKYISQAEAIGAKRAEHIPREQRLELKRLVGQSIVSAISTDFDTASELANNAEQFHTKRTIEVSKIWKLEYAVVILVSISIFFLLLHHLNLFNNYMEFFISTYAGSLGAFCSISMRRHSSRWNAESGRYAHFVEVFTRVLLGSIFGILFFIASRTSIIPPIFSHDTSDFYSLFIFCFASGYSERLVLNIISSYIQPQKEQE